MHWRRVFRLPLGSRGIERDVEDELAFHLTMRADRLRGEGIAPDDADATALARFGDRTRVREECITIDTQFEREVRRMEWLESIWSDVRYGLRMLRRMPLFTAVATITLALGIGATTAMFTLVNGILLRPLPYPTVDRLVDVFQAYPEKGLDSWGLSQENIVMYRDRATDFEAFAGYRDGAVTMRSEHGPERLTAVRVTADFFKVLGIHPAIGREFTRDEDAPGRNTVAVLANAFWLTQFGGRSSVIGAVVDIDGQPTRIVGVMPAGVGFPNPGVQVWLPMGLDPTRTHGWINAGLGRLKPGVSVEHVRRQTTAIMWDWARRAPNLMGLPAGGPERTKMATLVTPLQDAVTGKSSRPLSVLFAAVTLILLIATANVATLLSGRAVARQREIGLRTALGATGARVIRQLLTESVALALLGAILGVFLAVAGLRAFAASGLGGLPRMSEVHVDGRVLAFTLAVSVASGVLFGLSPAFHVVRSRVTSDLNAAQREGAYRGGRRLNNALVVTQLSLSVILLVAAGLVLKSFERLASVDLGFRPDHITSIALPLPQRLNDATAMAAFVRTSLDEVRAVPGVESASLSWALPFQGGGNVDGFRIEGRPPSANGTEEQMMQVAVSPGFFATLGIPLLYGRDFTTADDSTGAFVGIVDETMATRYWHGADAIGKRIRTGGDDVWFTIVGVAASVRDLDAATAAMPHLYVSIPQAGGTHLSLAVRTSGDGSNVIPAVRRAISQVEPAIPLDGVRTLTDIVDTSFASRRLTKILLTSFALLAVVLAGVGVYGVMSLHVASRSREFGIRLAVGAEPSQLVRLVLSEGGMLALAGVGVGVIGALVTTRWIQSLLYGVSPTDPAVFATLSLTLALIALAACYVPARRAAKGDPLVVLRSE
jgi:predicted permease